jgi:hypothetical protein
MAKKKVAKEKGSRKKVQYDPTIHRARHFPPAAGKQSSAKGTIPIKQPTATARDNELGFEVTETMWDAADNAATVCGGLPQLQIVIALMQMDD